ncbi:leucine Rich Repeat family protein [Loa loa]|uniref:Leucine Rich Repeat family protein n=1 Tax=Loa loa TaxID=7209 RepID=A0A1S0U912_LOALO|nr:leucine Rich Repeat family protein [Loa loa]EFO26857.2 leucine Rich Repeat family protein [Loa loa]
MVISSRQLILLTIFANYVTAFCPSLDSCTCDDKPDGYYIDCKGPIDTSLSGIIQLLGRRQVQKLTVTNSSWPVLEELPPANIRSLQLISCGIKKITNITFAKLADNLEDLTITKNMLTTVTFLGYLPKLISLNLNYNQLTDLPDNALKGVESLRHLRLEGNKICSLSSNSLLDIKNILELLDLSDNCLSNIPAQNLRNCIRLMYLDLSHNAIKEIANFQLMNLPLLKELRINNNQINYIAPMAFMNVPLLKHLVLRNNLISSIETERLFQVFKSLEVLDLSENMLNKVPSFKELLNLRQIHLNHNKISRIETLAFSSNRRLQLISLQCNQITAMSRNSFDSLDELVVLNLANNAIKKIERVMLDGMRNLQQLNLRNNSLSVLENSTFTSVSQITTLDLAHNGIHTIEKDVFTPLKDIFWLDLSSNLIKAIEKDTFKEKIANILLNDNPLHCDEKLDWLVNYLVANQVRTFLPYQTEVLCAGPEKYAGVRLKELMIVKANETMSKARHAFYANGQSDIAITQPPNPFEMVPVIGALTDAIPSVQNIPGINYLPKANGERILDAQKFNSAIEQLSSPLTRVIAGKQPGPADIEQFLQTIPNLVVNIPGIGDVDVSKLPPNILAHVLRGGQIPGLPSEALDKIMKEYLKRMYVAAETAKRERLVTAEFRNLLPPETLPQTLTTQVMQVADMSYPDRRQTQSIRDYYISQLAVSSAPDQLENLSVEKSRSLSSTVIEVIRMLPPGYNISRIPKPVIDALFRGEVPDFTLLPSELQQHLLTDGYRLIAALSTDANKTVEEMLHNLPTFKRPIKPTFIPYDINEVTNDLTQTKQRAEKLVRVQYYTALLLGFAGAASIAILGLICVYMKRKRLGDTEPNIDEDSLVNPNQMAQPQQSSTSGSKIDASLIKHCQHLSGNSHMFKI